MSGQRIHSLDEPVIIESGIEYHAPVGVAREHAADQVRRPTIQPDFLRQHNRAI